MKNFPGYTPVSRAIVPRDLAGNPHDLWVKAHDRRRAAAGHAHQCDPVEVRELVEYLSHVMELKPGDMIMAGSPEELPLPPGAKKGLHNGQVVICEVENLGKLVEYDRGSDRAAAEGAGEPGADAQALETRARTILLCRRSKQNDQQGGSSMPKLRFSRRDVLKGIDSGRRRLRVAGARPGAGAVGGHAGIDRGGAQGRPPGALHRGRSAGGGAVRQGVPGQISRHHGAGRAHRRRTPVPAHRAGGEERHPRGRRRRTARMRRTPSPGSAPGSSRRICRKMSRSISRRSTATATAPFSASEPRCRSSATTASW